MPHSITIRYGLMAVTEKFLSDSAEFRIGDDVIVRTARGIDVGEVMARPQAIPEGGAPATQGELLRPANDADRSIQAHIRDSKEPEEFSTCQTCIRERQLPMRLVGVEHLFSGDKIIFYFLADNRVDFRELVKELARRYRTRIEMRQIGVRDEAKLLADYEHCGRELCCRTFIRNLEPVTMRMAKMQKTTLDPSKISGHCGRLMCCLRFEDEVYSTLQAEIPARGAVCVTENFTGEVQSADMFRQEITLLLPDGSLEIVHLSSIKEIQGRRGRKPGGPYPAREERPRASGRFIRPGGPRDSTREFRERVGGHETRERPAGPDGGHAPKEEPQAGRQNEAGRQGEASPQDAE